MRLRLLLLVLMPAALLLAPKASANRPIDAEPMQAVQPPDEWPREFWDSVGGCPTQLWGCRQAPTPTPQSDCDKCKSAAKAKYDQKIKDCNDLPGPSRVDCYAGAAELYRADLIQCTIDNKCQDS